MGSEIEAFDLERMFLGDSSGLLILEIIVRTGIMYLVALSLVRFIGKRGIGQLSPFEYLIVIAMGSATGDPMFYPEIPIIHGVVVLATIISLQKMIVRLTQSSGPISRFIESTPTLLVDHGVLLEEKLKAEGVSHNDLFVKLREDGVEHLGEIRYVYLEPSGNISVFRLSPERQALGRSILPEEA